jgi:hypothetical protein
LHGGAVLHLHDVRIGKRSLTATIDGRRVSIPKDRLLAQKVLLAVSVRPERRLPAA